MATNPLSGLPTPLAPPRRRSAVSSPGVHRHEYPPSPLSAGTPADQQAQNSFAAYHASMLRKQRKVEAYFALREHERWLVAESNNLRSQLHTAVNNITAITADLKRETDLKLAAEGRVAELSKDIEDHRQAREDLDTSVVLLQGQNEELEKEKVALRQTFDDQLKAWQTERESLVDGKTSVDEALAGQQKIRFELQEANDVFREKIEVAERALSVAEDEQKNIVAKAEATQDELSDVQAKLKRCEQELDQQTDKVTALEQSLNTAQSSNTAFSDALERAGQDAVHANEAIINANRKIKNCDAELTLRATEIDKLKTRCKEIDMKVSENTDLQSMLNSANANLSSTQARLDETLKAKAAGEAKVERLQSKVNRAETERDVATRKRNEAQTTAATLNNELAKSRETATELGKKTKELDQRCLRTAHERDNAIAAKAEIESQVAKLREVETKGHLEVAELKQALREEKSIAEQVLHILNSSKKGTVDAKDEALVDKAKKLNDEQAMHLPVTPLKPQRDSSSPDNTNTASHARSLVLTTAPPLNKDTTKYDASDLANTLSSPTTDAAQKTTNKISFSMPTSAKIPPRGPKFPLSAGRQTIILSKTGCIAASQASDKPPSANGKRKRDDEPPSDPRSRKRNTDESGLSGRTDSDCGRGGRDGQNARGGRRGRLDEVYDRRW